jgi:hypothetical protein
MIEAHSNPSMSYLRANLKGIIFFSTPHRGSDMSGLLSKIFTSVLARKVFVSGLQQQSQLIKQINEDFRFRTQDLELVSAFETSMVPRIGVKASFFLC